MTMARQKFLFGSGIEKIMDHDPDPNCPERFDPDPVNIRPEPKPCLYYMYAEGEGRVTPWILPPPWYYLHNVNLGGGRRRVAPCILPLQCEWWSGEGGWRPRPGWTPTPRTSSLRSSPRRSISRHIQGVQEILCFSKILKYIPDSGLSVSPRCQWCTQW